MAKNFGKFESIMSPIVFSFSLHGHDINTSSKIRHFSVVFNNLFRILKRQRKTPFSGEAFKLELANHEGGRLSFNTMAMVTSEIKVKTEVRQYSVV